MFERLLDLLIQLWDQIFPGFVVDAYQQAAVLRLGRYNRTCAPGFHWKWPFIERVLEYDVCLTTMRLPPQTLMTHDGKAVVVAAIVKYRIADVQLFTTLIRDQADVLADTTMGTIRAQVRSMTLEDLTGDAPEGKIATKVRREVKQYGFELETVTFIDLAPVRSFRLVSHHAKDLDN